MQPARKFYSSLVWLVVLNMIIKPVWIFGIDRRVQMEVGSLEYGTYFALLNISIVFNFLLDWGLTTFFNRQLASGEPDISRRAGDFLVIKLLFTFIYTAFIFLITWISGVSRWEIVTGVIGIQVFTSLFLFFRAIITAQQWFVTDAWLSILDKTLMILCCGAILFFPTVFGYLDIYSFLWLQVISMAVAMITAWLVALSRGIRFNVHHTQFSPGKKLLQSALPYAIIVLLMSAHYRLDGFLLERIHHDGPHEAGTYAAAYRLLDAANMGGFLIISFLLPYVAKQWSAKKDISAVVLNLRHILLVFAIGVAAIAIFMAPWLQQLLYHSSNADAVRVFQLCLPALIGYGLVHIYGTVMTASGRITTFCRITAIALLINIVLNLVLIPRMGAEGCCIAALVSQLVCGLLCMFYVNNRLNVQPGIFSIGIYIFIGAGLAGIFYGGQSITQYNWLLIVTGILFSVIVMILTGLLKLKISRA